MAITLTDLGVDILALRLFPLLEIEDVQALDLTSRDIYRLTHHPAVWNALYQKSFPNEGFIGNGDSWISRFMARSDYKLYTWGYNNGNRLGHAQTEIPRSSRSRNTWSVAVPTQIRGHLRLKVAEVACGGFATTIRTVDGKLYTLGSLQPTSRLGIAREYPAAHEGHHMSLMKTFEPQRRFVQVSASRRMLFGLTSENEVFVWLDHKMEQGVSIDFGFSSSPLRTIRKIASAWDVLAAIVDGVGLAIVFGLNNLNRESITTGAIHTTTVTVPFTSYRSDHFSRPRDLSAGDGFVVYVNFRNEVFVVVASEPGQTVSRKPRKLSIGRDIMNDGATVTQLVASLGRFAIVASSGDVILASRKQEDEFTLEKVLGFPNVRIMQVALGDYHNLAVSETGEVFAWGREPQSSGAFGLGNTESLARMGAYPSAPTFVPDHTLKSPRKVNIRGVARIAAGGWQSAAVAVSCQMGGHS